MFQEYHFVSWIIAKNVFEKGIDKLRSNRRIFLSDFQMKNENESAIFGEIGIMKAVACDFIFEDTSRHHDMPIFEVVSCDIRVNILK